MAQNIQNQNEFQILAAIELSHNYLRSNAQNISLGDLYSLWKFKNKGYSLAKVQNPEDFNVLRRIQFIPIKHNQEEKMVAK